MQLNSASVGACTINKLEKSSESTTGHDTLYPLNSSFRVIFDRFVGCTRDSLTPEHSNLTVDYIEPAYIIEVYIELSHLGKSMVS